VFLDQIFKLHTQEELNSASKHGQVVYSNTVINCLSQWIADGVEVFRKPIFKTIFGAAPKSTQLQTISLWSGVCVEWL